MLLKSCDEIIQGAFLERLDGEQLIVQARQHDEWNGRRSDAGSLDGLKSLGIGQAEVQEDQVHLAIGEEMLGPLHGLDVGNFGLAPVMLPEHLAQ